MTIETAVVGGGDAADRHLAGLQRCPDATLTAICDPDETCARERATEYDITAYADFEGLLARESPDWIHLCTPPQTHLKLVRMALEDGIAVQIPTPATASVAEAERLEQLAAGHDAKVSLAHGRAFSPAMRRAGDLLANGAVGEPRSVSLVSTGRGAEPDEAGARGRPGPGGIGIGGGVARAVSLLLHLAGSPAGTSSVQTAVSVPGDTVQLHYATADGVTCTATVLPNDVPHRSIQVHGTDGRLDADLVTQSVTTLDSTEHTTPTDRVVGNAKRALGRVHTAAEQGLSAAKRAVRDDWATARQLDGYCYQLGEEVRAIQGTEPVPVPVEAGTWALRIMDAVNAAKQDRRGDRHVRIGTDSV